MKKSKNNYTSKVSLFLYAICQRFAFVRKLKVLLYYLDALLLIGIQKPVNNTKSKKKKVLLIYNYAFGDGVVFMTVGRNLRKIYPTSKYNLSVICQKGLNDLYESYNIFDEVIPFDLTGSTFNFITRRKLFKKLREEYYDIVLDPIGVAECTTNIFMSRAICSPEKITILDETLKNIMCPKKIYQKIYNRVIKVKKPNLSLVEYYNEFINGLSETIYQVELKNMESPKITLKLPSEFYMVFPSASTSLKKWPIERYADLIKMIYDKTHLPLVLAGTKMDQNSYNELIELIDVPIVNIIGKTSLMEFVSVIKKAKFVVTNDTSTYHISVVNQVPVSIITGGYTYDRYVKWEFKNNNMYLKPYIIVNNMKCFNCDNNCPLLKKEKETWPCLKRITVEKAWKVVEKMIDENR